MMAFTRQHLAHDRAATIMTNTDSARSTYTEIEMTRPQGAAICRTCWSGEMTNFFRRSLPSVESSVDSSFSPARLEIAGWASTSHPLAPVVFACPLLLSMASSRAPAIEDSRITARYTPSIVARVILAGFLKNRCTILSRSTGARHDIIAEISPYF